MTALVEDTDVATALGRTLTDAEGDQVAQLILTASAFVESRTGYRFAPGDYTIGRKARARLTLPGAVDEVTEVRKVDRRDGTAEVLVEGTDYNVRGRTLYLIDGCTCWLEVDFTVTAAVPAEIVSLVAALVASVVDAPAANVESETAGPFQVSYMTSSGRVYLAESDKAVLARYRQPRPAVDTLG